MHFSWLLCSVLSSGVLGTWKNREADFSYGEQVNHDMGKAVHDARETVSDLLDVKHNSMEQAYKYDQGEKKPKDGKPMEKPANEKLLENQMVKQMPTMEKHAEKPMPAMEKPMEKPMPAKEPMHPKEMPKESMSSGKY
ncbi:uncharacterized protein LOC111711601 isoform X2 [Eurytemora carolleeae]|uniref:uncharacterized protein LOC111711601 isoform X2 n=1 Tax=Eurytemora carolleeae TaxID=1294199 RepID=UPI000C76DAB5|nr:uncharacterized protein LOC111711601 isoform X2 [Eurytemora carolleeae]|eukprot:XP_023341768.1 uncharacterized protein LOC111711601 isoform X2 [Eurytemora affinis]